MRGFTLADKNEPGMARVARLFAWVFRSEKNMDLSDIYAFATLAIVVLMTLADGFRPLRRHVFGVFRGGVMPRSRVPLRAAECRRA
ncbi:MAG: hypothetical protein AAFZ18_27630 [Myxococcota bacterium]